MKTRFSITTRHLLTRAILRGCQLPESKAQPGVTRAGSGKEAGARPVYDRNARGPSAAPLGRGDS